MNRKVTQERQYAIAVKDTVITFECERNRRTYKIDFGRKPISRRMDESGCRLMARWWSRDRGGCLGDCPKCKCA